MSFSKKQRKEYNQYREHVSKELGIDKNKYNALRRVSQSLHRASEDYSMGRSDWRHNKNYDKNSPRYEDKHYGKDVAKAFSKAEALRKKIGGKGKIHFYHQTDPRGTALYAARKRINKQRYNTEGKPIY